MRGVYERTELNSPPHMQPKAERNEKILALLDMGHTPTEIAAMMQLSSRMVVCGVRFRWGKDRPSSNVEPIKPEARKPEPKPTGKARCQWLEGEPHERNFCGKKAVAHQTPWCPAHYERVFLRRNR